MAAIYPPIRGAFAHFSPGPLRGRSRLTLFEYSHSFDKVICAILPIPTVGYGLAGVWLLYLVGSIVPGVVSGIRNAGTWVNLLSPLVSPIPSSLTSNKFLKESTWYYFPIAVKAVCIKGM